jgi:hypothetical protein
MYPDTDVPRSISSKIFGWAEIPEINPFMSDISQIYERITRRENRSET